MKDEPADSRRHSNSWQEPTPRRREKIIAELLRTFDIFTEGIESVKWILPDVAKADCNVIEDAMGCG
jgi:hypothetical protein